MQCTPFFVFSLFLMIVLLLSHTTKYASACTFFLEADCLHYLPSKQSHVLSERSSGCSVPAYAPTEITRKGLTGFTVSWMKTSNQILPLCEMSSLPQISQNSKYSLTAAKLTQHPKSVKKIIGMKQDMEKKIVTFPVRIQSLNRRGR